MDSLRVKVGLQDCGQKGGNYSKCYICVDNSDPHVLYGGVDLYFIIL